MLADTDRAPSSDLEMKQRFANPLLPGLEDTAGEAFPVNSLTDGIANEGINPETSNASPRERSVDLGGLVPESQELEGTPAEEPAGEKLHDRMLAAAVNLSTSRNKRASDTKATTGLELCRMLDHGYSQSNKNEAGRPDDTVTRDELGSMFKTKLQLKLEKKELDVLFMECNGGDAADEVTLAQLEEWWDLRSGAGNTVDVTTVSLKHLKMISPHSSFRGYWDMVQAVLLVYIAVNLPYRIGFDSDTILWSFWFFFDLWCDLFFITDLFLNFRTAVVTPEGELVTEPSRVAHLYYRGWFPIDLVSCLPFGYVQYFMGPDATEDGQDATTNKAARMLRLFRLLKLLRLVRIKRILDRWQEEMYGKRLLNMVKLLLILLSFSHWICCMWFFVGNVPPEVDHDGISNVSGWVYEIYAPEAVPTMSKVDLYKTSYFWASLAVLMAGTSVCLLPASTWSTGHTRPFATTHARAPPRTLCY